MRMQTYRVSGVVALASLASCVGDLRDDGSQVTVTGIATATVTAGDDDTAGGSTSADDDDDGAATAADGGESETSPAGGDDTGFEPKFDVGGAETGEDGEGCMSGPNDDADGDGWTKAAGDCNDCDALVNPAAIEVVATEPDDMGVIPDPADEDCDGGIDNVGLPCDGGIALDDDDPLNAAAAIGLCKIAANDDDWGVVSAQYVRANGAAVAGADLQYGIKDEWGSNVDVQEGENMLVLSSGHARMPGDPDSCNSLTCYGDGAGTAPAGFPQDVPACPGSSAINDDIALQVTLRAPSNATGYSYNFDFYSFEYPEWVCTSYNDQYIALVDPAPVGSINGNISFDANANPVSVNIAFFEVCSGCPLGTGELSGTGFDTWNDAGATSWLVTTAPVEPMQEITITFAIWDTGDAAWDSTVLIDNFKWIADGGTVDVGTEPEG